MAKVRSTQEAQADLDSIDRYTIERYGGLAADDYMLGFDRVFLRLAEFPESGPVFRNVKPPIRCITHRSHRVFYDFDGETVTIIRVLHHAMNAAKRVKH